MTTWIILAIIGLLGELYIFFMQRSALEVCRAKDLPPDARFAMLPSYYRWGRVTSLMKWAAVVVLAIGGWWVPAGGVIVGGWVASAALPVPHGAFFTIFYRELDEPSNRAGPDVREAMRLALESVDREHGVTDRFRGSP
jgi:hypothetical protein